MSENLILAIEDSDEDFVAIERAVEKFGFQVRLQRATNATEAFDILNALRPINGRDQRLADPALILMNLNLPGMDGRELLIEIKGNDRFKQIPVIILTTSSNPRDIMYCYSNGASSYHVKSVGFEKFAASIDNIISYWFNSVTLPSPIR
jgi:CheY-like chemotaxis protein